MTSSLRAIFFDLGGTLFSNRDIPRVNTPALIEAGQRLGVEQGFGEIGLAFLQASRAVNDVYMRRSYYLHRDHFHDTYRAFAKTFDRVASDEFVEWFYEAQRSAMVEGLRLRDDCVETLRALREEGLTLSIVSNIDDDYLDGMLRNLELKPLFDYWISSESAQSCKPDARIFEIALEQAGCGPREAIFVGDSRIHDIQGAAAIGMETVLLLEEGGGSHLDDASFEVEPDHVISSLSELLALVERRAAS
ncbi:MAG: HAD family hydrolase [bacterium]|nr:HAD family hydrolase [bacterium]MCP5068430.1 HAD family hydrolase [bacterium]